MSANANANASANGLQIVPGDVGSIDPHARRVRFRLGPPGKTWPQVSEYDFGRFLKNPIIAWNHDLDELPIGKAEDIEREPDGGATMTACFAREAANPQADLVWRSIASGIVKSVSVGFAYGEPDANGLRKAIVIEVSFVSVGKDEDALVVDEAASFKGRIPAAHFDANTPTAYIDDDPRDPTPFVDPANEPCRCEIDLRGRPSGCFRTGAVNARSGPKGLRAPCTPADAERDRTRTDASEDIITKARAARDRRAAEAWKETQR